MNNICHKILLKLRINFLLLVLLSCNLTGKDVKTKAFYELNEAQIDSILHKVSLQAWTVSEKMNYYSSAFLGMPYDIKCVGDGPYALYEKEPLVNFNETNCMAFCEHVLALSISDNWENFFNNLQQIRYKDGIIGIKTRNHYTMADWLPQNAWLLKDVTAETGGAQTKKITRSISHRNFFRDKGITDTTDTLPDRVITIDYIPLSAIKNVKDYFKTGDIISLLFAKLDNIFSAHMVMVVMKNDKRYIRESSNSRMTTFDTPLDEWIKEKESKYAQRYLGITVMRVKESVNIPGKIIKPAQIKKLKNQ
ncbi:MAG: DUF1460 domain-containing protein [Calditrichaceae bacterium]|nr:DUF1460 domain-containing protein [Calditrichaceae bacterium]MBN2709550.1 DUF1460 domain-containing protein [Calditrichaceae bacterium]RQV96811.1 MAG: DUF1460 domain-containing protein [Calditrichota bacterium]